MSILLKTIKYGIVSLETGEVVGDTLFDEARKAKLSIWHNGWRVSKVGVAEVEVKAVGPTQKYNHVTKKWEESK